MALFSKVTAALRQALAERGQAMPAVPKPKGLSSHLTEQLAATSQPMNLIQVPDLTRKLVTRYGIREKGPAPTLGTEVQPVVLVDDLVGESDLIRPRIRPGAGSVVATSVASRAAVGIFNSPGSGVICHLQYVIIGGLVAAVWEGYAGGGSDPLQVGAGTRGFRNGLLPNQNPIVNVYGAASWVAGGALYNRIQQTAANNAILPFDAVIDENQGITWQISANASSTHYFSAVWTEEDKK